MSVELIHLRKLLQFLFSGRKQQISQVRSEVRLDAAKALGISGSGGDFYAPFWADVKDHVCSKSDLRSATKSRIEQNIRRGRLYPILTDGFLQWWDDQRRWTNEPFAIERAPSTTLRVNDILSVRLENFLTIKDSQGTSRYIYPYFSESPTLKNEAARISLWCFRKAFKALEYENFRILDVPRGRIFSPDRCYLEGDEEEILERRHRELWDLYVEIEENGNQSK